MTTNASAVLSEQPLTIPAALPLARSTPLSCGAETALTAASNANDNAQDLDAPFLHTVLIFDWDDTLFSSTWLSANIPNPFDEPLSPDSKEMYLFGQLEEAVSKLLQAAMAIGHVVIITNAEAGWVQLAAGRFMPGLMPLLEMVSVISARSTYEPFYPNNPTIWKIQAFYESVDSILTTNMVPPAQQAPVNMISFGDSQVERHALHAVSSHFNAVRTKSVKFMERPTIEQVQAQVELVTAHLDQLIIYEEDLDLVLSPPEEDSEETTFTCSRFLEPACITVSV